MLLTFVVEGKSLMAAAGGDKARCVVVVVIVVVVVVMVVVVEDYSVLGCVVWTDGDFQLIVW